MLEKVNQSDLIRFIVCNPLQRYIRKPDWNYMDKALTCVHGVYWGVINIKTGILKVYAACFFSVDKWKITAKQRTYRLNKLIF